MKFTNVLLVSGISAAAALGAVAPAIANCPLSQSQPVVRISNPNARVQRVTNVNGTRTIVQQRTVVVPVNRAW